MVFMALIGGSSVMAKGGHLNIMFVVDRLAPETRHKTLLAARTLTALTFLLIGVFGVRMAWDEYRFEVTSPGLGIPTWVYTVWLPILAFAIFGRAMGVLIRTWRGDARC
jgi:TRAP-type C4-dicarboxylate transport system permease small subunit